MAMENKQSAAPIQYDDNTVKCRKCGTPLVVQDITVVVPGAPDEVIARIWLCNGWDCGSIQKRWMVMGHYIDGYDGKREYIESTGERLRITKSMIANAMGQKKGIYFFTLDELKNAPALTGMDTYNPNAHIEVEQLY